MARESILDRLELHLLRFVYRHAIEVIWVVKSLVNGGPPLARRDVVG
jgi:hypothetical protein